MSGALLVASWAAAGAAIGTLLASRTHQLPVTGALRLVATRPGVSILTAIMFGVLAWRLDDAIDLVVYSSLVAVGVPLAITDIIEQRLPSALLYPAGAVLGVLFAGSAIVNSNGSSLVRALAGMATLAAFYLVLALASAGGLGAGDVKLGAVLGLALGWASWSALLIGTFLGWALGALAWLALRVGRCTSHDSVLPLGPYLLLGAFATIAAAPPG